MSLTLYYAPMSSASPILWALAELGVPYEGIEIDLKAGDQKQPALLAHNPMGQVPTLVDDGQGMFESSAIIVHLGQKYGVERGLWPAVGSPEHMLALTWLAWSAVTLGSSLRLIMLNTQDWWPAELRSEGQAAKGREQLDMQMTALDGHLATRPYLAGERFTLADAYAAAAIGWASSLVGFDLASTPNVGAWVKRCMSREAVKHMR